ncbi:MAG: glycosyltransferase [Bacteroidetes bacterium]|jgi:glycosyltransferase involved in cell wall biosynthesis|nr:glycosyltransferase [Bacteroidota bacterium]
MNVSKPKSTVVLPFFNAAATLERALESIAIQTDADFECIMVNNCSTDASDQIAKRFATKDERFVLKHENKAGVVFAFNKGASFARGKYLARMDADDVALPERLESQARFLDQYIDYGAVAGCVEYVPHKKQTDGFRRYVNWSNQVLTYEDIITNQFVEMPLVNPTTLWRKEISDKLGLYKKGDFPEDYEMWLRWLGAGIKIHKLPQTLLQWYDSNNRLTRSHSEYSDQAFFRIKSVYLAHWLKKHNPFHPEVLVWGASKISRRRAKFLEQHGIHIKAYIDIKRTRQIDKQIIYYKDIPPPQSAYILVYIREKNAQQKIQQFLAHHSYKMVSNYLLVS